MLSILTTHSVCYIQSKGLFNGDFWVKTSTCRLEQWMSCFLVLLSVLKCSMVLLVLCIILITDLSDLQERSKHLVLLDGFEEAIINSDTVISHPKVRSFTFLAYRTALDYQAIQIGEPNLRSHDKLVMECILLKPPISNIQPTLAACVHLTSLLRKATNGQGSHS